MSFSGRLVGVVLVVSVLSGCSLLPGQAPDAAPRDPAAPPTSRATTSAPTAPATPGATPTAAADPTVPDIDMTTFPTTDPPSPGQDDPDPGLRVRSTTIRGREASASWRVTIPVFSGAPAAKEVNRRVRAAADDLIRQVRRESQDDGGAKRTMTGEGIVATNDGRTAQVVIVFVDYLAGTASPSNYVTTTVVDVRRSRPVLLTQVVQNPPEGLRLFRTQVIKAARKKDEPVDKAGLAPKVANYANWQTTPEGITFFFAEYQLGGNGLRNYTVPWSSARLVLSAYGEKLLLPR